VQTHHIERLPGFPKREREFDLPVTHHTVADSIEGWSDALDELITSYYGGFKVEFNYSRIRPRGAPLKTSGGRAPGHLPLKAALHAVERILDWAGGRSLQPIEVYDICMFVARAVVAGGSRRSATICLFSPDDREMMAAKTGHWLAENPQRSGSNNSAVVDRSPASLRHFQRLFRSQKEYGEPGFYFTDDPEYGCNPCGEIGLHPVAHGPFSDAETARLRELGYENELGEETRLSGWQMCNLTTINAAQLDSADQFEHACQLAAFIGTLQAAYLDMPYLGPVTRFLNERESLLGVSICGIMDNPDLCLSPAILERGAEICRATNAFAAEAIGIRPAARTTCVKPEGTTSLLLDTGSGIHPHHAKRYFRRVQVNRGDPVYQHFRQTNPHMTEPSLYHPESDDVITFPVEAPPGALVRSDIGALQFLRLVKRVQKDWVQSGRAFATLSPGLHHNVSNTCTVNPDEWEEVERYIWENRAFFTGISLLPATGDKLYPQAPREEVVTAEDMAKWNRLKYERVDYRQLHEEGDQTRLRDTPACDSGLCES
jgi:ribonucleoside-diphosphate reductase alpha chain